MGLNVSFIFVFLIAFNFIFNISKNLKCRTKNTDMFMSLQLPQDRICIFQYLPNNGRHHSLVWEKEANDLDETREEELIFGQNKFNVSFHRFPNVSMFMKSFTEMHDYYESLHMGLTIGVPNGT